MKFQSLLLLGGLAAVQAVSPPEVCLDVWAYDDGKDICLEKIGVDYWGWTNGRYGTSGCDQCDCPDCPTSPPTPSDPPTKAPTPNPTPLPQKCIGLDGSFSGGEYCILL